MADGRPPLRCFLSYSAQARADADIVAAMFESLGVDTFRDVDIAFGQHIATTIRSSLERADFVCLVLSGPSRSQYLSFETGLALGLGKPIVAIIIGEAIDSDLPDLLMIRGKPGEITAVLPELRRFVKHVKPKELARSDRVSDPSAIKRAVASLAEARKSDDSSQRTQALVDTVALLFQQRDTELVREEAGEARPDLLLWNDALVAELGGPLIIECKYYGGGTGSVMANAAHALEQLRSFVDKSSAGLGILVFDHDRPRELPLAQYDSSEALSFWIDDLIAAVGEGSFVEEVWRRRSRAARGSEDMP